MRKRQRTSYSVVYRVNVLGLAYSIAVATAASAPGLHTTQIFQLKTKPHTISLSMPAN